MLKKYGWLVLVILLGSVLGFSLRQKDSVDPEPTATRPPTGTITMTATTIGFSTATSALILTLTLTPTSTETSTPTPTPTETPNWAYLDDDSDGVMNYADQCPNQYAETGNGYPNGDTGGGSDEEKPPDGNE